MTLLTSTIPELRLIHRGKVRETYEVDPDHLLLVGFVAIWLCLVLAGGAVHTFVAAWWSLELGAGKMREPAAREEAAAT